MPVYHAGAGQFHIAAFETQADLAFIISDLPEDRNMQLAAALAPPVEQFLGQP
jgi:hypothetical protein